MSSSHPTPNRPRKPLVGLAEELQGPDAEATRQRCSRQLDQLQDLTMITGEMTEEEKAQREALKRAISLARVILAPLPFRPVSS